MCVLDSVSMLKKYVGMRFVCVLDSVSMLKKYVGMLQTHSHIG